MIKKIVVIGPESTGKSTLCDQLSQKLGTIWCPEYAREYLLKHGMDYTYPDLLTIAKGQIALEDRHATAALGKSTLVVDTDMYVMKVWCEFVYDNCHQWILDRIAERKYDLYLLCNIDLPWVKDELREYPDLENRLKLFQMYQDILINQHVPWVEISGSYNQRLQKAVDAVERYILHP